MYKSKILLTSVVTVITISIFAFAACKKNSSGTLSNTDDNGGYASDNAKLENMNNDVISIADAAASTSGSNLRTTQVLGGCATVTNDTTVTPHVLTINFGPTNCTCADGKNRRGEIIVAYSGRYKDSASTHTITYSNYYVNDNQVMGSKTVTNNGMNGQGQVYYTITVNDSLNLGNGNGIISWTGSRTRTWLAGYLTSQRSDDEYSITGTTVLTRANGHVFTMNITTPLQVAASCEWIEAGVASITGQAGTRTLDYGTGNCDSEAQLTINGHTYNITLR